MENHITIATPRYSAQFDHSAVVAGLTRTYAQRGISVKSEPSLPGGKRSDLALRFSDGWTYVEVKTRNEKRSHARNISFRQGILRELMRLRAHSLKQLPRKESSLVVLSTSPSQDRREAISKITIAQSFRLRMFREKNDRVIGVMIFAPFRSARKSPTGWRYASTLIQNPNWTNPKDKFEKLVSVQL